MATGLNLHRDEAREKFLDPLRNSKFSVEQWMDGLEEELAELREARAWGDKSRFDHKVYDMLFCLFAIAAISDIDLDEQWEKGWAKKQKYLHPEA